MTKTEEKLNEMLKENTGRHMLDSGGAYGRHWERNQDKTFENEPAAVLTFEDSGIEITHNLYHWVNERLEYDEDMDERFQDYVNLPENEEESWFELIETFPETIGGCDIETINTYNGEDALSQTIQYTRFTYDDWCYIILQIHGGMDVRSGYGTPTIFTENDYYVLADNARATIRCTRSDIDPKQLELPGIHIDHEPHFWDTDDAGYSWSPESSEFYELQEYKISNDEKDRGKEKIYADEDGKGYCPICGSLLEVF